MLEEILPMIRRGILPRKKQDDSQATVMQKRRPEDGLIDWRRSTREIYNWVRALAQPYPGAFSFLNGERVWIWEARPDGVPIVNQRLRPGEVILDPQGWPWGATADGWIRIVSAQREGGQQRPQHRAAMTFLPEEIMIVCAHQAAN